MFLADSFVNSKIQLVKNEKIDVNLINSGPWTRICPQYTIMCPFVPSFSGNVGSVFDVVEFHYKKIDSKMDIHKDNKNSIAEICNTPRKSLV